MQNKKSLHKMNDDKAKAIRHRDKVIGIFASTICIIMYVAYVQNIIQNFSGHPVGIVQPFFAMINATLWVLYGWYKVDKKDWAVIIANFPGIFFGLITVITSLTAA